MARTSHSSAASPAPSKPEIWIQYKAHRARVLNTKASAQHSDTAPNILDGFRADLQALSMFPELPLDITIVWKSGMIRAKYSSDFRYAIKYLVRRASTTLQDTLSERSISRIYYAEGGTPLANEDLPKAPPRPTGSQGSRIPQSQAGPFQVTSPHVSLGSKLERPIVSARSQSVNGAPHVQPLAGSSRVRQSFVDAHATLPISPPQALPHAIAPHPTPSIGVCGTQILPPIFLSRGEASQPDFQRATYPTSPQTVRDVLQTSTTGTHDVQHSRLLPPVPLTSKVCIRLRDFTDDAVLSTCPVVRFLILRAVDSGRIGNTAKTYEAFITDGQSYAWVGLASALSGRVGDREDGLRAQVGSVVRLKTMTRLQVPSPDLCQVLVHDFELVESSADSSARSADDEPGVTPGRIDLPGIIPPFTSGPLTASSLSQSERAARLCAETKYQEERQRRLLLERVLADVCLDLDRRDSLTPAVLDALKRIDDLTDAAMVDD